MTIAQCRKALVAFLCAFLSAFAPMWAQRSGWPGWDAAAGCAIFAALSALAVWAMPNARPVPAAVQRLRDLAEARRAADQYAGTGQKPAAVINVPPRPTVAPAPPLPSGPRP